MSDTSPANDTTEQWIVTQKAFPLIRSGDHLGLFVNGILAADYYQSEAVFVVNVHENGNYRISRQVIVADEETARRVCRQIAGLPPVATPLPTWLSGMEARNAVE